MTGSRCFLPNFHQVALPLDTGHLGSLQHEKPADTHSLRHYVASDIYPWESGYVMVYRLNEV